MKKIPRIIPCICTTHTPCSVVSSTYGMPVLIPSGDGNQTWFGIKCMMCGRGGFLTMQYKSAYKAIVAWNSLQKELYQVAGRNIEFDKEYTHKDISNKNEYNKWVDDLKVGYAQGDFNKSCRPDFEIGKWNEV